MEHFEVCRGGANKIKSGMLFQFTPGVFNNLKLGDSTAFRILKVFVYVEDKACLNSMKTN